MRLALAAVGVASGAVLAASCNPIFGIVGRQEGPTWCEEDANATRSGYCRDFDRDAAPTEMQELGATYHGTIGVTDAQASSLPNSFLVQSEALTTGEGAVAGHLASFGPMTASAGLPGFTCQVDLLASDLLALAKAGHAIGVMGVGGQSMASRGSPEVVVFAFKSGGSFGITLEQLPTPMSPVRTVASCPDGTLPPKAGSGGLQGQEWITLEISVTPEVGDAGATGCTLVPPSSKSGMDGGKDAGRDGGDSGSAPDAGPSGAYILHVRLSFFDVATLRLVDDGFFGQPYFVYGMFLDGPASPATLHFDNARCTTLAGAP